MKTAGIKNRCLRILPWLTAGAIMHFSCATLHMPAQPPDIAPHELRRAAGDGIGVVVKAIENEDEYWQSFEEYLPRIGIVAVWVEIHNSGATPIQLRRSDWSLQIGNRKSAAMSADQVFQRYYEGFRVRMYSVQTDRRARLQMERAAWQPGGLAPSSRRAGYLFFRIGSETGSEWTRQAALLLRNPRSASGSKTTLKIVLAHANS